MTNIETALQKTVGFGVKEFIEKAIEGGWKKGYPNFKVEKVNDCGLWLDCKGLLGDFKFHYVREEILLDPLAWQAVGKVEGWKEDKYTRYDHFDNMPEYKEKMHRFVDNLCQQSTMQL